VNVLNERCEHDCFSLAPPLRNFIDVKTNAQMFALCVVTKVFKIEATINFIPKYLCYAGVLKRNKCFG
jgi:hypothetical protein